MIKAGRTVNVGDHIPFVICIEPIGSVTTQVAAAALTPLGAAVSDGSPAAAIATPEGLAPPPASSPVGDAQFASPTPAEASPVSAGAAGATPDKMQQQGGTAASSGGGSTSFASRAYHPEEVRKSGGRLHLDVEWYLSNQILPPVARELSKYSLYPR